MPEAVSTYRVFIATPGGLEAERKAFREALREWNETFSLDRGIAFYPIGWEDTLPGKGRPQSRINIDVRKCDFLILLLWDRWGTPPGGEGSYTSGTEEEFNIANECIAGTSMPMRQIVVLFKGVEARQLSDPGEQLGKVLDFKRQLEKEKSLLYATFDTTDEFSKFLQKQLWAWLSDLEQNGNGKKPVSPAGGPIPPATPVERGSTLPDSGDGEGPASPLIEEAERLADEGRLSDAEAKFATAILKQPAAEDLLSYGRFLRRVGRLQQAQVMFSEAKRIAIASHDERSLAGTYGHLGMVMRIRGDLDGAEAMYRKALEIDQKLDRPEGIARQYGNLGNVMQTRGDLDGAEAMHRKSLEISEKLGRLEGMARQYSNLGLVMGTRGDLDAAEAMHSKALEINEKLGRLEGTAANYGNLGNVMGIRGDLEGAEAMYRKSLAIEEKIGGLEGMANAYGSLGNVMQGRGDLEGAEAMYRKALAIDEKLGRLEGMASEYTNLGIVMRRRGELDGADAMYRKSLEINQKLGRLEGMATNYSNLGNVMESRGELDEAREMWTTSRDLYAKVGVQHMVDRVQGWIDKLPG